MIFLWRTVFLHGFCPGRPPLNGTLHHTFRPHARVCARVCVRAYGFQCVRLSVQGGPTLAHLLAETIPEFPTAVEKVIPLFVHSSRGQSLRGIGLSCPGAIIKWDRPINVSSWRANLVQAYVSSLGRNIDRPIPLNCQSWLW